MAGCATGPQPILRRYVNGSQSSDVRAGAGAAGLVDTGADVGGDGNWAVALGFAVIYKSDTHHSRLILKVTSPEAAFIFLRMRLP